METDTKVCITSQVKIDLIFESFNYFKNIQLFHDGGPYHIEISTLICRVNQWTGFYMIGTSVMKVDYKLVLVDLLMVNSSCKIRSKTKFYNGKEKDFNESEKERLNKENEEI